MSADKNEPVMAATLVSWGQIFQLCRQASVDCQIHQEPQGCHCNLHNTPQTASRLATVHLNTHSII